MKIILIIATLLMGGCSSAKKMNMMIVNSNLEVDMICAHQTKRVTLLRSDDGRVAKKCGYWGEEGDRIAGYWITGQFEWRSGQKNGFQFYK